MLLRVAMGFSLLETLLLAGVLLAWADRVAGGRLLAAFLAAIGVWIAGNELPNWFGPEVETLALHLLATAPLTSAVFFHFCVVFCRAPVGRRWVVAGYALGGVAALASQILLPARFTDHPDIGRLALAEPAAVITSISWVLLGLAGVTVLIRSLLRARADGSTPARAQIAAVTASCLWGLVCIGGYAIALMQWPIYPFPLLALPLYPLMLVYGILRYGVFVANAWAGRALVWTLLLAGGAAVVGLMPLLLPFESRWLSGLAVAAGCLALNGPVRRFVQRLIYPGGEVSAQDLTAWREALQHSDGFAALSAKATELLSQRAGMRTAVLVETAEGADARLPGAAVLPRLTLRRTDAGWSPIWSGWEAAPPGQRHAAELFSTVLADAALHVEQAEQVAARERERQVQARLAELGALAATVAHDIRNPLNIIGMAVAMAPAETRQEVGVQVARIAHLASDLLDYAKPWKLMPQRVDLAATVRGIARREVDVRLSDAWPQSLWMDRVDPHRIEQALVNLIENARGAAPDGCTIDVDSDDSAVRLHVCDNGAGVPEDFRTRLFEPFASRSQGGTGLGLAIVARVAQAHQGRAMLTERPPWRTCFTMELPR
ncbi:Signal transduction histidine kinase [Roseateles sp. YR242]|uniref:sensor histidine kinase n=1 Tax=Roseateles sp. YR242 TaxID=1855305 RepID=UPI0008CEEB8C|nr:HAMP domain-containing sensor histidine kinase [Roseateles sp. YR242]SEL10815.1 Signal transduction histidine kinase [Roseateles sp. YR242]